MDLEKLMLQLNAENYANEAELTEELLKKERETREKILALIILLWGKDKKIKSAVNKEVALLFDFLKATLAEQMSILNEEAFLKTVYSIQKTVGGNAFSMPKMPNMNWHIDNRSYLDDLEYYAARLQHDIEINIGKHKVFDTKPEGLSAIVDKPFDALNKSTKAMVDTELTYVERQANLSAYQSQNMDSYRYLATLDTKTCEVCGELDSKIFLNKDAQVGVNYPPMHPHCRCVVVGVRDYDERVARDKNGEIFYVPGDTTYKEWKDRLKKENEKFQVNEIYQRKSNNEKIFITDVAINKVSFAKISGYSIESLTKLKGEHSELLKYAKINNNSNEVVKIFDYSINELGVFLGDESKVLLNENIDFRTIISHAKNNSLILIHNHPKATSFSFSDISLFLNNKIQTLTVVTNKGKVFVLNKTDAFDIVGIYDTIDKEIKSAKDMTNAMDIFTERVLKKIQKFGVEYIR